MSIPCWVKFVVKLTILAVGVVVKNYPVPVPKLISTRNMKSELDGFANQAVAIYIYHVMHTMQPICRTS